MLVLALAPTVVPETTSGKVKIDSAWMHSSLGGGPIVSVRGAVGGRVGDVVGPLLGALVGGCVSAIVGEEVGTPSYLQPRQSSTTS